MAKKQVVVVGAGAAGMVSMKIRVILILASLDHKIDVLHLSRVLQHLRNILTSSK